MQQLVVLRASAFWARIKSSYSGIIIANTNTVTSYKLQNDVMDASSTAMLGLSTMLLIVLENILPSKLYKL